MKDIPSGTGPSNFVVFAMIVIAIVLVWFVFFTDHHHYSPDQKILLQKSNQN